VIKHMQAALGPRKRTGAKPQPRTAAKHLAGLTQLSRLDNRGRISSKVGPPSCTSLSLEGPCGRVRAGVRSAAQPGARKSGTEKGESGQRRISEAGFSKTALRNADISDYSAGCNWVTSQKRRNSLLRLGSDSPGECAISEQTYTTCREG